jgi:hypothetical protein
VSPDRRRIQRCRRHFLDFFPDGFADATYLETERAPKWRAHREWVEALGPAELTCLVRAGRFDDVAQRAIRIEARTNLLFSFEKMALRDAVRSAAGAGVFAAGLHEWLDGPSQRARFEHWVDSVAALPRRGTRVLTWPVVSIFGFLARPRVHLYVKPTVTRAAAEAYGFPLNYVSRPAWPTYASVLDFANTIRRDVADLGPRDMIDVQSFLWVLGSAEYE